MASVILRILSGAHLGAEIELTLGTWVIGRDDSCDIILTDSSIAARHAALRITDAGVLEFDPLDGTILTALEEAPEDGMLVAGRIYRLGGVLFAWGVADSPDEFWNEVERSLAELSAPKIEPAAARQAAGSAEPTEPREPVAAQASAGEDAPGEPSGEAAAEAGEFGEAPADDSADGAPENGAGEGDTGGRAARIVLVAILAAAIAGAALLARDRRAAETQSARAAVEEGWVSLAAEAQDASLLARVKAFLGLAPKDEAALLEQVRLLVKSEGFDDVTVALREDGSWRFAGAVADDAERGRLVRFARALRENSVLDVTVDSDYTTALAAAFNTNDFWPDVRLEKGSASAVAANASNAAASAPDALVVSGYMLSNVVEEKAFETALASVPEITSSSSGRRFTITRRILHKTDLEAIFAKLFKAASLTGVKAEYRPGRVRLLTVLTQERREKLDAILKNFCAQAGVLVRIDVVNEAGEAPVAAAAIAAPAAPAESVDPMKPRFRVVGVSGGALKFITLSSGEKVFVGGTLPGGFVLEAANFDALTLSKNGKRIKYPLRLSK